MKPRRAWFVPLLTLTLALAPSARAEEPVPASIAGAGALPAVTIGPDTPAGTALSSPPGLRPGAAPPAAREAPGEPNAACTGAFSLSVSPSVVAVGQSFNVIWCDPSWSGIDQGFWVESYRLYISENPSAGYAQFADYTASRTSTTLTADSGDAGRKYWFFVRAYGYRNTIAGPMADTMDTNSATVQVQSTTPPPPSCTADAYTLCLYGSRFKVQADYRDYSGNTGLGKAVSLTTDTGWFWFFTQANVETVVKFVSFCGSGSNSYGVYAGGLTDLQVTLKVTDTKTGLYREYTNFLGTDWRLIKDAWPVCP